MKNARLLICLMIFFSCSNSYSDQFDKIDAEEVIRVEFIGPTDASCEEYVKKHEHIDRALIEEFIDHINHAKVDEKPWKGKCWDRINIIKEDTVISFCYNTFVFGPEESGTFFRFSQE